MGITCQPRAFPCYDKGINRHMSGADEQQPQPNTTTYVPLAEAVLIFQAAGIYRGERTISRYCQNGGLDCVKEQLPSGAMGYFINRESIQDRIIELKQLEASGHVAARHDTSGQDAASPDLSRHDETETKALIERAEKAEKEREGLRDEILQLKIDVGVRKELLNQAKQLTEHMRGERDDMMRYVGALEGQVRQLGAAPVDRLSLASPSTVERHESPDDTNAPARATDADVL